MAAVVSPISDTNVVASSTRPSASMRSGAFAARGCATAMPTARCCSLFRLGCADGRLHRRPSRHRRQSRSGKHPASCSKRPSAGAARKASRTRSRDDRRHGFSQGKFQGPTKARAARRKIRRGSDTGSLPAQRGIDSVTPRIISSFFDDTRPRAHIKPAFRTEAVEYNVRNCWNAPMGNRRTLELMRRRAARRRGGGGVSAKPTPRPPAAAAARGKPPCPSR